MSPPSNASPQATVPLYQGSNSREACRMIRLEGGKYVAYCDGECGTSVNTGLRSFRQAVNYVRVEGWDNRKIRDQWFNYCANCGESAQPELDRTGVHFTKRAISDDGY